MKKAYSLSLDKDLMTATQALADNQRRTVSGMVEYMLFQYGELECNTLKVVEALLSNLEQNHKIDLSGIDMDKEVAIAMDQLDSDKMIFLDALHGA